jgi:hypothetical protein
LVIETDRLELRLPREDELAVLARAARVIASPGETRLHLEWMYEPSPGMERKFVQRHWRALAHWRPESWHLPLAVYVGFRKLGYRDNGQHLVYRADTGRTTEYRLRLDRATWAQTRSGGHCAIKGVEACLPMFGADADS